MRRKHIAFMAVAAALLSLGSLSPFAVRSAKVANAGGATELTPAFSQTSASDANGRLQTAPMTSRDEQIHAASRFTGSSQPTVDAVTRFRRQSVSTDPNELALAMRGAMQCAAGRSQRAEAASKGLDIGELFRALPEIVQRAISQTMAAEADMHLLCAAMGASPYTYLELSNRIGESSLPVRLSGIRAPSRTTQPGASQQREEERRTTLLDLAAPTEESRTALQIGAGNIVHMAMLNGALKGADSTVNPAILEALIACGAGADCAGDSLNRLYFCSMTNGRACGGVTVADAIANSLSVSEQEQHNRAVQQISEAIRTRNTKFFGL